MNKVLSLVTACLCLLTAFSAQAQGLPDTGQTKCYNDSTTITCPQPGADFYGQDAEYVKVRSYTDLGNGIVRDTVTGLEWVQDGNVMASRNPDFDNDDTAGDGRVTWQHALDYVELLNAEEYLGHDDWRLPSIKELASLVDSSRRSNAFDPVFGTVASCWSSTTSASSTNLAWRVDFTRGYVSSYSKASNDYVRAVRGNPLPANNFINNNDGTITDTDTGLMWQQATAPGTYTWQQALAYCEDLDLAGYTDWRLPDRNELQSIVDYSRYNPAIDPVFSAVAVGAYYWSSTTGADLGAMAWFVVFGDGYVDYLFKTFDRGYVRAVRGGQYVLLGDLGTLCIEDYHCAEGHECVDGECQPEPEDNPPALTSGPFVAAGTWPMVSSSQVSPTYMSQNYSVLWTFSDDYASCPEGECTHTAEYSVAGSDSWEPMTVQSNAEAGYAYLDLPVTTELSNAMTYAFRYSVTDCASQTAQSETYYFRVATSDAPPVITSGPFVAAGVWPVLSTSVSKALVFDRNYNVLWTFSDDYAGCAGLCTHRARYRKVGEELWTSLSVSTDPEGDWYAYATLPVESLDEGTYQFRFDVRDCAGQRTYSTYHYFKVVAGGYPVCELSRDCNEGEQCVEGQCSTCNIVWSGFSSGSVSTQETARTEIATQEATVAIVGFGGWCDLNLPFSLCPEDYNCFYGYPDSSLWEVCQSGLYAFTPRLGIPLTGIWDVQCEPAL